MSASKKTTAKKTTAKKTTAKRTTAKRTGSLVDRNLKAERLSASDSPDESIAVPKKTDQSEAPSLPLALITGSSSMTPPKPSLIAARLHTARHGRGTKGVSCQIKNASVTNHRGDLDQTRTGDPQGDLIPYTDEWKDRLRALLTDSAFVAGPEIAKLPSDDLVFVLSAMPFEFRWKAQELYRTGIRYFGKVPWPAPNDTASADAQPDPDKLFRPMGCPEGPGAGQRFGLAWFDGLQTHTVSPWRSMHEDIVRRELKRISQLVGYEFTKDLMAMANEMKSCPEKIRQSLDSRSLAEPTREYFEELSAKIQALLELQNDQVEVARNAFACGVLYASKIAYPHSTVQNGAAWFSKEKAWGMIILHAFIRHGTELERMPLLARLGCTNFNAYSKGSKEVARFGADASIHTPEISFGQYNKLFAEAKNWLLKNPPSYRPTVEFLMENSMKAHIKRVQRSGAQAELNLRNRKRLENANKIIKENNSLAVKAVGAENTRQLAAKRIVTARSIPG